MLVFPRVPSLVILLSDSPWITVNYSHGFINLWCILNLFFFPTQYSFVFLLCSRLIHTFSTAYWAFYNRYNTSKLEVENMAREKSHSEYSMPVACTLNSASSSTLPNFDPLSFSSICSSFSTTNLSSSCKPQQWLWLSLLHPRNNHLLSLQWTLLSAFEWKRNHQMAALFSFSPTNLFTYPFFPSL